MKLTNAEKTQRYRQRHPERVKASGARYKETYPERRRATVAAYYEKNKERISKYFADRYKNEPWFRAQRALEGRNRRVKNKLAGPRLNFPKHLHQKYGITVEDYARLLLSQGFACAICRETLDLDTRGQAHVDHSHATGRVRALLCNNCNGGLGLFREDPERLNRAIRFVAAQQRLDSLDGGAR